MRARWRGRERRSWRLHDARAILAYLGVKPFDGTPFYRATGFVDAGEAVEYPYLETLKGEPIWAQPMILKANRWPN